MSPGSRTSSGNSSIFRKNRSGSNGVTRSRPSWPQVVSQRRAVIDGAGNAGRVLQRPVVRMAGRPPGAAGQALFRLAGSEGKGPTQTSAIVVLLLGPICPPPSYPNTVPHTVAPQSLDRDGAPRLAPPTLPLVAPSPTFKKASRRLPHSVQRRLSSSVRSSPARAKVVRSRLAVVPVLHQYIADHGFVGVADPRLPFLDHRSPVHLVGSGSGRSASRQSIRVSCERLILSPVTHSC